MIVIRNVFHCKPGQAKTLVSKMKESFAARTGAPQARILTDVAAGFWTVVLEIEAESLEAWDKEMRAYAAPDARRPMEGYMDLVTGGYREIFKVE